MEFADEEFVQNVNDLSEPDKPDYVPKGTKGFVRSVKGGPYPYIFYPHGDFYMPWLVNADEIVRVKVDSYSN
jgi:hypothetical protein